MAKGVQMHAPDWIDVNSQVTAIGEDFGCITRFDVRTERDMLTVVARAYRIAGDDTDKPVVQALASRPLRSRPDAAIMCFSTALDCYRQLDSGVLGARDRGITHKWNGRPHIARADRRS